MILNFPSYLVYTISSYVRCQTVEASLQTATSSRRGMWAEVAQGGLISPLLFSIYVNDMPAPAPRRAGSKCRRHDHHNHVPKVDASRQLPEIIPHRPSTVVE
jgi:hypothetical protein